MCAIKVRGCVGHALPRSSSPAGGCGWAALPSVSFRDIHTTLSSQIPRNSAETSRGQACQPKPRCCPKAVVARLDRVRPPSHACPGNQETLEGGSRLGCCYQVAELWLPPRTVWYLCQQSWRVPTCIVATQFTSRSAVLENLRGKSLLPHALLEYRKKGPSCCFFVCCVVPSVCCEMKTPSRRLQTPYTLIVIRKAVGLEIAWPFQPRTD